LDEVEVKLNLWLWLLVKEEVSGLGVTWKCALTCLPFWVWNKEFKRRRPRKEGSWKNAEGLDLEECALTGQFDVGHCFISFFFPFFFNSVSPFLFIVAREGSSICWWLSFSMTVVGGLLMLK